MVRVRESKPPRYPEMKPALRPASQFFDLLRFVIGQRVQLLLTPRLAGVIFTPTSTPTTTLGWRGVQETGRRRLSLFVVPFSLVPFRSSPFVRYNDLKRMY